MQKRNRRWMRPKSTAIDTLNLGLCITVIFPSCSRGWAWIELLRGLHMYGILCEEPATAQSRERESRGAGNKERRQATAMALVDAWMKWREKVGATVVGTMLEPKKHSIEVCFYINAWKNFLCMWTTAWGDIELTNGPTTNEHRRCRCACLGFFLASLRLPTAWSLWMLKRRERTFQHRGITLQGRCSVPKKHSTEGCCCIEAE